VRRASWLLFFVLAICPAFATVEAFREPVHVARTFSVEVQDRGRPVAGLPVALVTYEKQEEIAHKATNALGIAKFEHLRRGHYYLQWGEQWDGRKAVGEEIRVGQGLKQIVREWPCCVVDIQQVIGNVTALKWTIAGLESMKLLASDPNAVAPLVGVKLDLHELRTYRLIAEHETDQQGRFHFDKVEPGIYVLHAFGGADPKLRSEGYIRLEVNPEASPGQLGISPSVVDGSYVGERIASAPRLDQVKQ